MRKISEKNYPQKDQPYWVKSHGFHRSLLQRNFISFSLRKTFSLNLLLKSDFKRYLGYHEKIYHELLRFFLRDQPYRFRNVSQTSELKSTSENVSAST